MRQPLWHVLLPADRPDGHRVLLARRPELALLADCPLPAVAPADAVEASRASAAPELAPVSPYVHLHRVNEYRWQDVPRE